MRNEKEMMDLIIRTAENDERIRGVYMSGSRTNKNAPKDIFQDYDIVYVVTETASFIEDESWIDVFGERLYMQLPEKMGKILGYDSNFDNCYGYLMQLADGNRIDLHLQTLEYSIRDMKHDRLCIILLDKDKAFPEIPPATDQDHWIKRPSEEEYSCCCNEFWWLLNNMGKGLWRGEMPYAMDMLNFYVRPQFIKMISWYIGIHTYFSCSIGKSGKYLYKYLSQDKMDRIYLTYPTGNIEAVWQSLFEMCDFFDAVAKEVGRGLGYAYNDKEAYNSRLFLDCTYELPGDAKEILMVRRMKATDVEEIARIWLESNIETHDFIPEAYWRGNYENVKNRLYESEVYVYEDHKGIHGFAGINKGYLAGIFVKKEMRSKGVGKALMDICKSKYFRINLHVYCMNKKAVKFYMKEGFVINKKQMNYPTDGTAGCSEFEMIWQKEGNSTNPVAINGAENERK
ncbi:MAG: GNAT family N-acetyltransferase [Clostridiales bacterium]|nr:GNAT family N-acetyltransferase [Clostridiales bacterium]